MHGRQCDVKRRDEDCLSRVHSCQENGIRKMGAEKDHSNIVIYIYFLKRR